MTARAQSATATASALIQHIHNLLINDNAEIAKDYLSSLETLIDEIIRVNQ